MGSKQQKPDFKQLSVNFQRIVRLEAEIGNSFSSIMQELQDRMGKSLQNFFERALFLYPCGSEEHKDLEAQVWVELIKSKLNYSFDNDYHTIDVYIWGIARKLRQKWKSNFAENPVSLDLETLELNSERDPNPDDKMDIESCLEKLAKFDLAQYMVIYFYYIENKTERETAEILKIDYNQVHRLKIKAQDFLVKCME